VPSTRGFLLKPQQKCPYRGFSPFTGRYCLSINEFEIYIQAYAAIIDYMSYYNNVRIHSSFKYLPPAEYYLAALSGRIGPCIVKV